MRQCSGARYGRQIEKWPEGGVRPSVRTLRILAAVYDISWDRLVDVADLEGMPDDDRQAFLDISDLRHGDSLNFPIPRPRRRGPGALRGGDGPRVARPVTVEATAAVREPLAVPDPNFPPSGQAGDCPARSPISPGGMGRWPSCALRLPSKPPRALW
jgi:transcriptional regulator with XRE-family HTH domain